MTVVRRPADRFVSAMRYFDQIRKRKNEVRQFMTRSERVTMAQFHNLTLDIFSPFPNVHPEVRKCAGR